MQLPTDLKPLLLNYLKYQDFENGIKYLNVSTLRVNDYLKTNNRLFLDFFDFNFSPTKNLFSDNDWCNYGSKMYLRAFVEYCLEYDLEHFDLYKLLNGNVPDDPDSNIYTLVNDIEDIDKLQYRYFSNDYYKYLKSTKALIRLYAISKNHKLKSSVFFGANYRESLRLDFYHHIVDYALEFKGLFIITKLIEHLFDQEKTLLYDVMEYIIKEVSKEELFEIMSNIHKP